MITFSAKMYNVTAGEYCNNTPTQYSFAEYLGYTGGQPATNPNVSFNDWLFGGISAGVATDDPYDQDVMFEQGGNTLTNIPYTRFIVSRGTNIGTRFEYYAKKYFDENGSWPVLRLLTSDSTDDYYIEWTRTSPDGFTVKAPGTYMRWPSCFQWSDDFDNSYYDDRKYNSMFSMVFLKASSINDLTNVDILYNGALRYDSSTGGLVTLVSYATAMLSIGNTKYYCYDANTYFGKVGSRTFYKSYNGSCLVFWKNYTSSSLYKGPVTIQPYINIHSDVTGEDTRSSPFTGWDCRYSLNLHTPVSYYLSGGVWWGLRTEGSQNATFDPNDLYVFAFANTSAGWQSVIDTVVSESNISVAMVRTEVYSYLQGAFGGGGGSDVDPDYLPDPDAPITPQPPDNPDPYYDPTSDPDSPDYDPTKDPDNPAYDPDSPHPPFTPPSTEDGGDDPSPLPPQDDIPAPETPPSYVTTNALFTLYNPAAADLTNLANFLWSPAWSIDTFKKIFANPLDCILGLMVMPYLAVDVGTKNMNVGNIDTGVPMRYFTKQFYDFNCGNFSITEFYTSYLDYAPYTKISIFLPYIGDQQLNTDEVMGKTLNVKYRFDLATGDCVAFVSVDGSVLYSFSGNCAARLPLSSSNYSGLLPSITGAVVAAGSMAAGVPALGAASALAVSSMKQDIRHTGSISGSAGLMGVQTPYLIITRPRQALPRGQNSFMGYPSFITESLGGLTGYTEVESCHLEHVPCTDEELREIENLLKGGVLF